MKTKMNLLKLIRDNADRPRSWSIKQEGEDATIYVYDVIGGILGGIDAEQFAREVAGIDAKTINVRINSPGGDVFDARAMATALRNHGAKVNAYIDGWAASAATTVAMAANHVEIASGGFFMIHNAWTLMLGNRHDLLDMAAVLEKVDQAIAADYIKRTGADAKQVTEWMDAETWFNADEALEHGFVDAVMGKAENRWSWNLSAYRNAPKIEAQDQTEQLREALSRRLALLERCSA